MASLEGRVSRHRVAQPRAQKPRLAAAEVLRHLQHPARLRSNVLTAQYFAAGSSVDSDAAALATLSLVVNGALAALPRLQQDIVRRCDIGGELHRVVAVELSISERHFYRLRSRAIAVVASALAAGPDSAISVAPALDALDASLLHADALEQAGAFEETRSLLGRLAPTLGATLAAVRVLCRDAQVCAAHGRISEARIQLEAASALVGKLPSPDVKVAALEVDVAVADFEAAVGNYRKVRDVLRHALPHLRQQVNELPTIRAVESLVYALLLSADRFRDDGKLIEAVSMAREALDVLRFAPGARAVLSVRANFVLLVSLCLLQNLSPLRVRELAMLWSEAMQRGLIRQASDIAGDLTALYRIRGDPRAALEFARVSLPTVRAAGGAGTIPIVLLEVAAAHQSLNQLEAAAAIIDEARDRAIDAYGRSLADLRLAELALQERRFGTAAEAAAWARAGFVQVGNSRLAGIAAWVAAEAYGAQAKRRAASSAINECLTLLGAGSFPYEYSRALRIAAKVTGDQKYLKSV